MKSEAWRQTVSIFSLALFVISTVTGLLLWLVPGRSWTLLGLAKPVYRDLHIYLSLALMAAVAVHGWFNRRPLGRYLGLRRAALWQALGVVALLVGAVLARSLA